MKASPEILYKVSTRNFVREERSVSSCGPLTPSFYFRSSLVLLFRDTPRDALYCGDNLDILKRIPNDTADLIYIDPPFFSNRQYEVIWGDEAEKRSFEDRWEGGMSVYVDWMRERVREMYRVLKPNGSFYLHCDWHAAHHLRVMLDELFLPKHFQNEIIWAYRTGGATQRRWSRKHDNIYFYTKSDDYTFNLKKERVYYDKPFFSPKQDEQGRWYADVLPVDVWEIPAVINVSKERLGYPTQKPEALLEKIITASSNEGDVVLDAFCGCGTAMAVAQRLKRHWIGVDISPTAIKLVARRLQALGAKKDETYATFNTPSTETDLKELKPLEFQNWVIDEMGAKHSRTKSGDFGIDGHIEKTLWRDSAGIQVKQSESVGRPEIQKFESALRGQKYERGFMVAFSFTKQAREEVSQMKKRGIEIKLTEVSDLLHKSKTIL